MSSKLQRILLRFNVRLRTIHHILTSYFAFTGISLQSEELHRQMVRMVFACPQERGHRETSWAPPEIAVIVSDLANSRQDSHGIWSTPVPYVASQKVGNGELPSATATGSRAWCGLLCLRALHISGPAEGGNWTGPGRTVEKSSAFIVW